MYYPKKKNEERFAQLHLEGRKVVVSHFPKKITNVLKNFDENYDASICNKARLKKMKIIDELVQSEDHWRITDFIFELQFCGKYGCDLLCLHIRRNVRTPNVNVSGKNLREELVN